MAIFISFVLVLDYFDYEHEDDSRNKKGAPKIQSACGKSENYFAPRIASFAAFATWNFTTRLAGIEMVSPVAGLRPMRAARFFNFNLPRPGRVEGFFAFL